MSYNASEQATLNFYQWEYRHRGYYHFDTPVDLEVPYVPFTHKSNTPNKRIDDGKVPSLFKSISNLILPPKKEEKEEELTPLEPRVLEASSLPDTVGFSICFPNKQEILPQRNIEFLNMLSFSEHSISFEIIANANEIKIQIVCSEQDKQRIASHLKAYFPTAILHEQYIDDFGFDIHENIAIADFGMNDEFMRPISTSESFAIDPLTSMIATMDILQSNDIAVFQILFKGITSPLVNDISYAVSDGAGGSFFDDAPEMPHCAKDKIANPLFAVVMRIATQGESNIRSQYIAQELARSISAVSSSEYNKLIPLSNEGYSYDFHFYNLHNRLSNRLGFILNSKELNTFLHYPNKSVVSRKLGASDTKTKQLPQNLIRQKYLLGINEHNGVETNVMLGDEMRLRHTHIIGATGVGKSTLIANMMIEDMNAGNGCALFDPHGDIVEDILLRIPEHRKQDVIIIDPSDEQYSIGFNLLGANTDAEKIVLSSDLVSSFKRHATAWGDNMSAVLSNAINTFLESNRNGTLIELKRFLLEESFRNEFLTSVDDPSIHYYWNNEYMMVQKRIAPLLTRIDTFLRPKVIRYMLAQTGGIDFKTCIEEKKIVLIKLSQGLIGEENSFLLGSIFLSKFNQVAQGRQSLAKSQRHPYYIYLDEFQNFITPSITRILSGSRKYGLGLILAHQELGQIDDPKILNSVISNPYTRICFRLGDSDAKRLESGFSYFEQPDLQSLGTGEAIMRVGSSSDDFNVSTFSLKKVANSADVNKDFIITNTRNHYASKKEDIEELLISMLPKNQRKSKKEIQAFKPVVELIPKGEVILKEETIAEKKETSLEQEKQRILKKEEERESESKHRAIQNYVLSLGQQRNFITQLEVPTADGGRIDVVLKRDKLKIAVEVSVTNTTDYELQNITKCLREDMSHVFLISESKVHLSNIKKKAKEKFDALMYKKISFGTPAQFLTFLGKFETKPKKAIKQVRGYRVKSNYKDIGNSDAHSRNQKIQDIILRGKNKDT
ncbi:type IV secretory system conjugative DNA transfer family protein [Ascidiimonas sp. W6]|uniref:type IV secretory system conjugative DNA transfer family protein n=1 Tax=Ascidiimonas meishanensis TaxID=3128903 RepID=UPI0030ED836C